MNNKPVLFLDSGVGGIPYCRDFHFRNPQETIYYLADRQNFPYGPRSREEIASILISLTEKCIRTIDPKIAVVACNTASISALDPLRRKFPNLPFVGTVPAIKPAATASKNKKVGVLGTERTIKDIKSLNIIDSSQCEIIGIPAPQLVEFIELYFYETGEDEKTELVKKYIDIFRAKGVDTLVLGCTHFLYLLEEFRREAASTSMSGNTIQVFDSLEGITKRIEYLLNESGGLLKAGEDASPSCWFLLTGKNPPDASWTTRACDLEFDICLFDEI
jgi:glutamate racemase